MTLDEHTMPFSGITDLSRIVADLSETIDVSGVILFDAGANPIGLVPGIAMDDDTLALSAVTCSNSSSIFGKLFCLANLEHIYLDFSDNMIIVVPLMHGSLHLMSAARKSVSYPSLLARMYELAKSITVLLGTTGDHHAPGSLPSSTPRSILELNQEDSYRLMDLFIDFLSSFGFPSYVLQADAARLSKISILRKASLGRSLKESIKFLSSICATAGIPTVSQYVDKGNWGAVYRLSDGAVLKITRDESEARASASISGRHNGFIVDIYRIFSISIYGMPTPFYIIVREFADPMKGGSPEDLKVFDLALRMLRRRASGVSPEVFHDIEAPYDDAEESIHVLASAMADGIARELQDVNIEFSDFHDMNFGIRNDQLCLFDLSLSSTDNVVLEEIEIAQHL